MAPCPFPEGGHLSSHEGLSKAQSYTTSVTLKGKGSNISDEKQHLSLKQAANKELYPGQEQGRCLYKSDIFSHLK